MWRLIEGYESYFVNELGEVLSIKNKKQRILKKKLDKNTGYYKIILSEKRKVKTYNIHRLVAEAFIPNPLNYKYINHKDENKQNNSINNLEWCTNKYNCNYGSKREKLSKSHSKRILQFDKTGNLIKEWNSIKEIKNTLNIRIEWSLTHNTLKNNCYWKYKKEMINNDIFT